MVNNVNVNPFVMQLVADHDRATGLNISRNCPFDRQHASALQFFDSREYLSFVTDSRAILVRGMRPNGTVIIINTLEDDRTITIRNLEGRYLRVDETNRVSFANLQGEGEDFRVHWITQVDADSEIAGATKFQNSVTALWLAFIEEQEVVKRYDNEQSSEDAVEEK